METIVIKNCVASGWSSLFRKEFVYIDVFDEEQERYLCDRIFINKKLKVKFGESMVRPNSKYEIVFCRIKKRDLDKFLECMKELEDKMLLFGHTDYIESCESLWNEINVKVEDLISKK